MKALKASSVLLPALSQVQEMPPDQVLKRHGDDGKQPGSERVLQNVGYKRFVSAAEFPPGVICKHFNNLEGSPPQLSPILTL